MNFAALQAALVKLTTDVNTLVNASTAAQTAIDALTSEVTQVDTDTLAAIAGATPPPPPPPPPPPVLSFTAFLAAVAAFQADTNITQQAQIDAVTAAIVAATI